ncbi:hypothetical protein [Agrobacterium rosae]|uniref:hypothetical protein n=1 Tax=Agrobacterium rosae TaxID=1972867 RepID=UPI0020343B29|nr:hypothetical protein [Agrobacterium rosae]MCM2435367.1 hypothetical protein [Agrobacterium rosae]
MKYDSDDELPFYDTPWLTYDRVCRFLVVAEDIAGSDFDKFGLLGTAHRLAAELGMTLEQAHDDTYRRYAGYRDVFEIDRSAFLRSVDLLRRQYGEERLRQLYALK